MVEVTADCVADSEISTAALYGHLLVKDANGQLIDANFWGADTLPDSISEIGKFRLSADFFDLPAVPADAEVYMYYKWQQFIMPSAKFVGSAATKGG